MYPHSLISPTPYKNRSHANDFANRSDKTNDLRGFSTSNSYSYYGNSNYKNHKYFQNNRDIIIKKKSGYNDSLQQKTLVVFVYEEKLKSCDNFNEMVGSIVLVDKPIKFYVTDMANIQRNFFEINKEVYKDGIKNVLIVYFTHTSFFDETYINALAQQYFSDKTIFGLTINFVDASEYENKENDKEKFMRSIKVLYPKNIESHLHMLQFVKMKDISKTFIHIKDAFTSAKNELTYRDLCLREDSIIIPIFNHQTKFNENSPILDNA